MVPLIVVFIIMYYNNVFFLINNRIITFLTGQIVRKWRCIVDFKRHLVRWV